MDRQEARKQSTRKQETIDEKTTASNVRLIEFDRFKQNIPSKSSRIYFLQLYMESSRVRLHVETQVNKFNIEIQHLFQIQCYETKNQL